MAKDKRTSSDNGQARGRLIVNGVLIAIGCIGWAITLVLLTKAVWR